jgi:serine/threonine-protein kinase
MPTNRDGATNGNPVQSTNEVVARSTCGDNGCVAIDVGLPSGTPQIWDYANAHWTTVTEFFNDTSCHNTKSTEYLTTALTAQQDGSLAGDQIEEWTAGCYVKTSVVYRRTGGLNSNSQLPDPSTEPTWHNPPPAAGFRGKYRLTLKANSSETPSVENYVADTHCLRAGERCLSYVSFEDGSAPIPLVYQGGFWTGNVTRDETCQQGTSHITESFSFPLPANAADPLQNVTGTVGFTGYSQCFATGPGQATFERIGN